MIENYLNEVYCMNAGKLVSALPPVSTESVITDPMFGVSTKKLKPKDTYDWGADPSAGDPDRWWAYHRPIYEQCRRVLKPGGTLAWAMGRKFHQRFPEWFGGYRIWSFTRFQHRGLSTSGHIWLVQSKEQKPIPFPDKDSLIVLEEKSDLLKYHPCPKSINEMLFLVEALTKGGQIVLDPFCGLGSTLVAAALLKRKYIGCDLSERYCRVAKKRLADLSLVT
jgi:site-specific DNA-methyltransferase (adenine-specific)